MNDRPDDGAPADDAQADDTLADDAQATIQYCRRHAGRHPPIPVLCEPH